MDCPNGCNNKLNKEKIYACKCCSMKFCDDTCLTFHITNKHPTKLQKLPLRSKNRSIFIRDGLIINDVFKDPYFDFKNFEKVIKNGKVHSLGCGSFGEVYLAKHKLDGNLFAIKYLNKDRISEIGIQPDLIYREIDCHLSLIHPNIARLYSYYEDNLGYYLIMEYADNGSLFNLLQTQGSQTEEQTFKYFIQVAAACQFLHENNMIHRDIKPENCLLDKNGDVKICDFGWTVESSKGARETFCGTYEYMAPEIVKELPYNQSIDVWSLGVLLFELLHGYSPFRVNISLILGST